MTGPKPKPDSPFCECRIEFFRYGRCLTCQKPLQCVNCRGALTTHYYDGMHMGCDLSKHDMGPGRLIGWKLAAAWSGIAIGCLVAWVAIMKAVAAAVAFATR